MQKYLLTENLTGINTINIEKVVQDWNNKFTILQYHDEYTFVIYGSKKKHTKTDISKQQALEVINELGLLRVRNGFLKNASSYKSKEFIKSEIERLQMLLNEKEAEIQVLSQSVLLYEDSLG